MSVSVLYLFIGALAGLVVTAFFFMRRKPEASMEHELKDLLHRMEDFKDTLSGRFSQELHAMRQELATHLSSNRQSAEHAQQAVHKQMLDFTAGVTEMSQKLQRVEGSMKEVASFQDILRTPKLRGRWGEASLEHLLAEYFPEELYERQHYFASGEAVDAILKQPDGKILPIDSKFPLENFTRMVEAESEAEKTRYRKLFLDDARREIDAVAAKYILPEEGTTDFALVFIPAESVYYEMVNNLKDVDLGDYARKKKILLVSPNTLYLSLQTLQGWARQARVSREAQEILKRLGRVIQDAEKLQDDFRKLGGHLTNARSAYDASEKRLTLMTDRAGRLLESGEKELLDSPEKT